MGHRTAGMGRLYLIPGETFEGQYVHLVIWEDCAHVVVLQALQSHPSETIVIPHSDAVALRLAQCLNPTLPSGVHQKALEVYSYLFATIGVCTTSIS